MAYFGGEDTPAVGDDGLEAKKADYSPTSEASLEGEAGGEEAAAFGDYAEPDQKAEPGRKADLEDEEADLFGEADFHTTAPPPAARLRSRAGAGAGAGAGWGVDKPDDQKDDEEKHNANVLDFETERADDGGRVQPSARVPDCPQLWTGSRLNKATELLPNHWLKIGRHPKAHFLLNNAGVSRNQCSIRWDSHERKVELRVECETGTNVNGRPFSLDRVYLEHGDRVRILGKGQMFDFVLDLRPVGLGFGDPKRKAREGQKAVLAPAARKAKLVGGLRSLGQQIEKAEAEAFEFEKEYYAIQSRRSVRVKEIEDMQTQYQFYVQDTQRLEKHLEDSRQAWLDKLDGLYESNEEAIKPIIVETAGLQDKVEKLQLKKDELARSIHPERYAVADVSGANELEFNASQRDAEGRSPVEDEEDAFAGLSGLEDNRASGAEASATEDEPVAKASNKSDGTSPRPDSRKREAGAPSGDDEDEDAPLLPSSKRPRSDMSGEARSGGSGPTWVCEDKAAATGVCEDKAAATGVCEDKAAATGVGT